MAHSAHTLREGAPQDLERRNVKTKRAFIADDEPQFREWLRRAVERNGWAVTECRDGLELVETLGQNRDDGVVFLDVMMPDMDGIEAVERIAELTEPRPIHFITGGPSINCHAARLLAMKRGLNIREFFLKPLSLSQLSGALSRYS